jgi:hypothetical protein
LSLSGPRICSIPRQEKALGSVRELTVCDRRGVLPVAGIRACSHGGGSFSETERPQIAIRVVLAGNQSLLRAVETVVSRPEYEVVGEAVSGEQVLPLVRAAEPALLLLDLEITNSSPDWLLERRGCRPLAERRGRRYPARASAWSAAYVMTSVALAEIPRFLREITAGPGR